MRIFKYLAAANMAYAAIRLRRDEGGEFEITGEETEEELDALLADLTGESPFARGDLGGRGDDMLDPRKFRQWKLMVMAMQRQAGSTRQWKDFQSYGCHCIPEGRRRIGVAGYGAPVDSIDNACRSFHQCYRCLEDEHADEGGCDGEKTRYKVTINENTGEISCRNKPGTCQYNVCQCDLQIAQRLSTAFPVWESKYSKRQGKFDREASCQKTGKGGAVFEECCGDKTTFPNNSIKRSNQCCVGTESKPLGQC
jgi:hypothetical protein